MASLSQLEDRLSSKRSDKSAQETKKDNAEKLRDEAKKRLKDVEKIQKTLKNSFDWEASAVTSAIKNTDSNFEKAVYIDDKADTKNSDTMLSDHEKNPEDDSRLSSAISNLGSEITELNTYIDERKNEISECNSKIASLNWEITCLKAEIVAEKDRQAREKLKDTISNLFN